MEHLAAVSSSQEPGFSTSYTHSGRPSLGGGGRPVVMNCVTSVPTVSRQAPIHSRAAHLLFYDDGLSGTTSSSSRSANLNSPEFETREIASSFSAVESSPPWNSSSPETTIGSTPGSRASYAQAVRYDPRNQEDRACSKSPESGGIPESIPASTSSGGKLGDAYHPFEASDSAIDGDTPKSKNISKLKHIFGESSKSKWKAVDGDKSGKTPKIQAAFRNPGLNIPSTVQVKLVQYKGVQNKTSWENYSLQINEDEPGVILERINTNSVLNTALDDRLQLSLRPPSELKRHSQRRLHFTSTKEGLECHLQFPADPSAEHWISRIEKIYFPEGESCPQQNWFGSSNQSSRFKHKAKTHSEEDSSMGGSTKGKNLFHKLNKKLAKQSGTNSGASISSKHPFSFSLDEFKLGSTTENIPLIMEICIAIIDEYGLDIEGIYRRSCNKTAREDLITELSKDLPDIDVQSARWLDVHAVGAVLKAFLRELTDRLLPKDTGDRLLETCNPNFDLNLRLAQFRAEFDSLRQSGQHTQHLNCLVFLCEHLGRVVQHEASNKMSPHNLAVVFSPNLFVESDYLADSSNREEIESALNKQIMACELLICYRSWIFGSIGSPEQPEPESWYSSDGVGGGKGNLQPLLTATATTPSQSTSERSTKEPMVSSTPPKHHPPTFELGAAEAEDSSENACDLVQRFVDAAIRRAATIATSLAPSTADTSASGSPTTSSSGNHGHGRHMGPSASAQQLQRGLAFEAASHAGSRRLTKTRRQSETEASASDINGLTGNSESASDFGNTEFSNPALRRSHRLLRTPLLSLTSRSHGSNTTTDTATGNISSRDRSKRKGVFLSTTSSENPLSLMKRSVDSLHLIVTNISNMPTTTSGSSPVATISPTVLAPTENADDEEDDDEVTLPPQPIIAGGRESKRTSLPPPPVGAQSLGVPGNPQPGSGGHYYSRPPLSTAKSIEVLCSDIPEKPT